MKLSTLIKRANRAFEENGDMEVEIETPMTIEKANRTKVNESDVHGMTFIVEQRL